MKDTASKQNQVIPPLPKKKRVDNLGNRKKRLFYKDGNSTMLFCKDLTENGCRVLISAINDFAGKLGANVVGKFIITQ